MMIGLLGFSFAVPFLVAFGVVRLDFLGLCFDIARCVLFRSGICDWLPNGPFIKYPRTNVFLHWRPATVNGMT